MKIVVTGIDGSGKSSQISRLLDYALQNSCPFGLVWLRWAPFFMKSVGRVMRRFSGKTRTGRTDEVQLQYTKERLFRNNWLKGAYFVLGSLDYFLVSMVKILAASLRNKHLLFDRYYFDFVIDQSINFQWDPETTWRVIKRLGHWFPGVQRVIFIDVSPEVAIRRKDDIPDLEYLRKRAAKYRYLGEKLHWVKINGDQAFDEVTADITAVFQNIIQGDDRQS